MPEGVTFSGGECLLQMDRLCPLLQRLNVEKIHTATETSLFASELYLDISLKHIDLFNFDVKILDDKQCHTILDAKLRNYYANLSTLLKSSKPGVFRVPVIGGYTDLAENKERVKDFF